MQRYAIWFPIKLEHQGSGEVIAISRNMSTSGLLLATASNIEVGAPVTIRFRAHVGDESEQELSGVIVRREDNAEDPGGLWPHRIAVQFQELAPDLAPLLEELGSELDA